MLADEKRDIGLQKALVDICKGFSVFLYRDVSVYFKHQGLNDSSSSLDLYDKYYNESKAAGVWDEGRKLGYLNKKKLWTEEEEDLLKKKNDAIVALYKIKNKKTFKSELEKYQEKIDEEIAKLEPLEKKRSFMVGTTCESIAQRRMSDESILGSIFVDDKLQEPYFGEEKEDLLTNLDMENIRSSYYKIIKDLSYERIKEISLLPVFIRMFGLCKGDASKFFGKPVMDMTLNQVDLGGYGGYFLKVFETHDIPESIERNPNAVIEHVRRAKNIKGKGANRRKTTNSNEKVAHVGASKEELEELGFDTSSPEAELLNSSGKKKLSFKDLLKIRH